MGASKEVAASKGTRHGTRQADKEQLLKSQHSVMQEVKTKAHVTAPAEKRIFENKSALKKSRNLNVIFWFVKS
jgi:hypothetical protein